MATKAAKKAAKKASKTAVKKRATRAVFDTSSLAVAYLNQIVAEDMARFVAMRTGSVAGPRAARKAVR